MLSNKALQTCVTRIARESEKDDFHLTERFVRSNSITVEFPEKLAKTLDLAASVGIASAHSPCPFSVAINLPEPLLT